MQCVVCQFKLRFTSLYNEGFCTKGHTFLYQAGHEPNHKVGVIHNLRTSRD